jgi:UDPglucose--hexose-1-phosphate uridylyltransferase
VPGLDGPPIPHMSDRGSPIAPSRVWANADFGFTGDGIEPSDPHRRHNPLTDDWVLVAYGRNRRPWRGLIERLDTEEPVVYHPGCYVCPSNTRASGETNPHYESTFVFTNDFAALQPTVDPTDVQHGLLKRETHAGTCRVVCYSARHDHRLSIMTPDSIGAVIDVWRQQSEELGAKYRWVQVFENNGEVMGASNPHPHGQIWAGTFLPTLPAREDITHYRYAIQHGSSLLLDYLVQEKASSRVVVDSDRWAALVPFWAAWPFETILIPKRPVHRMVEVEGEARASLAQMLGELLARYDNLFQHPFPYSMGWHGAPFADYDTAHWQLHAHFYPPLLRSASIRKFMVGYELLAEVQRDFSPEEAASRLRELPSTHYTMWPTR